MSVLRINTFEIHTQNVNPITIFYSPLTTHY